MNKQPRYLGDLFHRIVWLLAVPAAGCGSSVAPALEADSAVDVGSPVDTGYDAGPPPVDRPAVDAGHDAGPPPVDVGPRDGLQNEKAPVPAAVKIELVHRLQDAGLKELEVASFVSPKWVPQMADALDVMAGIARRADVRFSVLTPNMKGFEAAVTAKPDEIVVFASASEAFSQRNINCSIAESIERFAPVVAAAKAAGIHVRGAISCAVGCPYEGDIAPDRVGMVAGLMAGLLVSAQPPRGTTRLSDWLAQSQDVVGKRYASELARHY